ncbi:MAG TPA: glycosyltransferase [Vicinamibacterales bacterium]|nr:glycosyltransferase [Vicinamibacterales bacterium]
MTEGHLDRIDGGSITGWAWDSDRPNEPVRVDLHVDGKLHRSVLADALRPDLADAGIGNGRHAFEIRLTDRHLDGEEHLFQLCCHGTLTELHGSPRRWAAPDSDTTRSIARRLARRQGLDERIRQRDESRPPSTPKVSIVIPCFNLGHYLDEAVDSVLEQTFDDFEILIVDDASTDEATRDLLDQYDRPRTRVFRLPHQGVSGTRNSGIERSNGQYLCFLDADDVLDPQFLARTLAPLEADAGLGFVSCWLKTFGSDEWVWRQDRCDLPAVLAECTVLTASPVRRSILDEVGGFDAASGELFAEDWDLWISIVERGHRGTILPEVLFYYRRYAESNSRRWDNPEFVARVTRLLFERHEASYRQHLHEVLMLKELRSGDLLRKNYDLQREVENRLAPAVANRRAQTRQLRERLATVDSGQNPGARAGLSWGDLDRLSPLSADWGFDRGSPVDRHYIEAFLSSHAADIHGDVLEVGDSQYTRRFGGDRVASSSVIDVDKANPAATIVADLRKADAIATGRFDCFIMTQTAYLIDDIGAVVAECARILKPGGVLLATLPCAIRLEPITGLDADFWRLGPRAAADLFGRAFPAQQVSVAPYGNLLTTVAFLYGVAHEELRRDELDTVDGRYPLTIGVRAVAGMAPPAPEGPQ